MSFTFFPDPRSFAYMAKPTAACHFCKASGDCLDGGHFSGQESIEAICMTCMQAGRLVDLNISANDVQKSALDPSFGDPEKIANQIVYCTPSLPTWQDCSWPVKRGRPYRFIKIASKHDYASKDEFLKSLHDCDDDDPSWLWDMLPDRPINNMKEGQYDLSFYLFDHDGHKLTTWDAN